MPASSDAPRNRALLIGPAPSNGQHNGNSNSVAALLTRHAMNIDACPDVYRGLARIGRRDAEWTLIVVCVDGLDSFEMSFFLEAAKLLPGIPLLVYGHDGSESRIRQAIRLGAMSRIDEAVLIPLLQRNGAAGRKAEAVSRAPMPEPAAPAEDYFTQWDDEEADANAENGIDGDEEGALAVEMDEGPVDGDEAPSAQSRTPEPSPPRVPWLRYADSPARVSPRQRAAPPPANPPPSIHEPLLTPEELRALMDDPETPLEPAPNQPPLPR